MMESCSSVASDASRLVADYMPETFDYEIVNADDVTKFVVRLRIRDRDEALQWLREFQFRTKTQWIVASNATTTGSHAHFEYNCSFVCHHSDYRKVMICVTCGFVLLTHEIKCIYCFRC